ncbi:MAG: hypothetical protein ABIH52_03900 [Candidatus Aenigmatarchaeota archaeon]
MRGQIYSFIVILIMVPLFIFILTYISALQQADVDIFEQIVADQIHQTETIISDDFDRALQITSKRALLSLINHVLSNGSYIQGTEDLMTELVTNGSYKNSSDVLMYNNTVADWKNKILNVSSGFNKYINYSNLTISNYNGLNLKASINYMVGITDRLNKSRIEKNITKDILFSVEGFEDPLFSINTTSAGGSVVRNIKAHPYPYYAEKLVTGTIRYGNCTGNVTFDKADTGTDNILVTTNATNVSGVFGGIIGELDDLPVLATCYVVGATDAISLINNNLTPINYMEVYLDEFTGVWSLPIKEALEKGYYTTFTNSGPNILERIEGSFAPSTDGLETFVNVPELLAVGYPDKPEEISVAYLHLDDQTDQACLQFRGLGIYQSWFRLDVAHSNKYNLAELGYAVC